MRNELTTLLQEIASSQGISAKLHIDYPENPEFGDYSSNIALVGSKEKGMKPQELAKEIVALFKERMPASVEAVTIAGPGFINITLKPEVFAEQAIEIARGKGIYGKNTLESADKVMIEYTQPNPFKEFHVGHLVNNAIGEALSRLVEWNGAEIKRATYHGDVGLHVAKTLWFLLSSPQEITVQSLGAGYARGHEAYETDEKAKKEIIALNKKIYDKSDAKVNELYEKGRSVSFDNFEKMYARLGSTFDYHFYESQAAGVGKELVEQGITKGIFEESEGATVFKGERHGLHTRVFLNKDGLPTYEAKELGLAKIKHDAYPYTHSLTVTGNEQDAYFKVVEKAIGEVFPDMKGVLSHVSHGMFRLPSGKMSSRTGTIIPAALLIDDVKSMVKEKISSRELSAEEKEEIAEAVAIAAIKYTILRQSIGGDIIFDSAASLSFEGDSGPYLQYSAVRAQAVLEKARQSDIKGKIISAQKIGLLERLLSRFPDLIERARKEYAPQYIASYLISLAAEFNSFYARQVIVDASDVHSPYYIEVTKAFLITMTHGLDVLGIKVPKKM